MATRSRSRSTVKAFNRDAYEQRVEELLAQTEEERYRHGAGLTDELALAPIYEQNAELFERPAVEALGDLVDRGGDELERNRALLAFATDGYLDRQSAPLTDAIGTAEARAVIMWRGEAIAYRAARPRIAKMSDRAARNGLFESWLQAVEAINPLRRERLDLRHRLAQELGYPDQVALVRRTRGWDPEQLGVQVRQALVATETGYYAAMRRAMGSIGIEQGDGTHADAWHLLGGPGWDGWFPGRRLVPVMEATFNGLGMPLTGRSGATLDLEARPGKSPRAFCAIVRVPDDVRLVVNLHGGWDDFRATMHEAGHLAHFVEVDRALPAGERLVGDMSVTEAYAMLTENLLGEPAWLGEQLGMAPDDARAFDDFLAFFTMHRLRRLGATHLYELSLYRGGPDAVQRATFAGSVGLLTGVRVPEELYLSIDDTMYTGSYLRAMMLAGALGDALAERHGAEWWMAAGAGAELRELFGRGLGWNAERVVASLGYDGLDWRPVLRKIRTQLIGEMSGYGGPNFTTKAGTRKI